MVAIYDLIARRKPDRLIVRKPAQLQNSALINRTSKVDLIFVLPSFLCRQPRWVHAEQFKVFGR